MSAEPRHRVLLIKPVLPYPPNQGTKVASFGVIQALRPHFDVTVLARITSRDETRHARDLEAWCERVVTVMAPSRKSVFHRAAYKLFYHLESALTRRSLKSLYDCPGALMRAARALSKEHFDFVIVEYWQLYRIARYFPPERCALLTHDIDMLVNRQATLLERSLPRKIALLRRWLLEQREEITAYRTVRKIWALTERDKSAVASLSGGRAEVEVMPVGVDTEFFAPSGMRRNPGEVLFMGHMGASFNLDALEFFVREVYPLLAGTPRLSVTIVGGHLPESLEFFGLQSDVEVVGPVPDVKPYLHRASCLVIPLRFGGGLRIRVLEAMSAGIPVVCTGVAVAGMPFKPEKDYMPAESPEEFARAIRRLLADEGLCAAISESARRTVREEYGAATQQRKLVNLVTRAAGLS